MTVEPKYPDVRDAYRTARLSPDRKMAQETLAELTGTTRRHIIRIENGEHRPLPALRDRIAAALEVDPESLPAATPAPFRNGAA